jgi:anti-sigma B factor antagonist
MSGAKQDLFSVHGEQRGRTVHLRLSGELDMATSPVLEEWLSNAMLNGNVEIVVDLEDVTFMDGSALHAFLRAADRANRSGRSLGIVRASDVVRRVLQVTRTTHLLRHEVPAFSSPAAVPPLSVPEPDDWIQSGILAEGSSAG